MSKELAKVFSLISEKEKYRHDNNFTYVEFTVYEIAEIKQALTTDRTLEIDKLKSRGEKS